MNEQAKTIRFIDSGYRTLFTIPDGASIILTYANGETVTRTCRYLDDYHTQIGSNIFHICEFAERMERNETTYAPAAPLCPTPEALETRFAQEPCDAYLLYQLKRSDETRGICFEPFSRLQALGITVSSADYVPVYGGVLPKVPFEKRQLLLETLYERFNADRPADFTGHSLSVSDVVVLKQSGKISCHYVDRFGFTELPQFYSARSHTPRENRPPLLQRLKAKPPQRRQAKQPPAKQTGLER